MQLKEEAVFTLKFDGKPVLNELGELEQRLNDVKEAQKAVEKGTKEWAENKEEIKALQAQIKSVREEMGTAGLTVRQLEVYARELNRELKDLTPGTDAYIKKSAELQDVNSRLLEHRQTIRGVGEEVEKSRSVWGQMKEWVAAAFTITAVVEFGRAVVGFVADSIKEFRAFQSASADMAANLGITGKVVDYFNEQARLMGPTLGKSAAEMLEGFKLVGSANSDLVKTPELLAQVAREAVTLSNAAKMTLADATASLVGSMNQFNAGADQSTRFINVMAGDAQVGSAEISDMASALKASGIVANTANLSFEQTNSALQSLSKESLKGEQAGTMLRNVLLTLMAGAKETNPRSWVWIKPWRIWTSKIYPRRKPRSCSAKRT